MATWPLPSKPLHLGFRRQDVPNTLRTPTDLPGAPAKVRRLATASIEHIDGDMILTDSEYATLMGFFRSTLADGSLSFDWTDPHDGTSVTMRFRDRPRAVAQTPKGTRVSLPLEILP